MYQFLTTKFFSILILVIFDFLLSLHIHLDKVKQEHCLTKCTNGLIGGLDTAIFKSEVNRSEDPQAKYVYYQIGGGNETKFKTVCQLDLTKDCNLIAYSELCTCRYKDINVINLNISLAVQEHDNGTKLRGAVVRSNDSEPIYSELQELPIIYASDDTTGHLIINQEPIEMNSDLVKQFNGRELFIEYSCSSQGNPCVIEISTNDSNYKVEGKEHAVYYKSYNKSEVVIVTIRRALCSLVGKITTLRLEIHMNYQQAPKQDISIWGIVSTIFNIIFGIIIVYLG
ncbi:unnamed protein product [Lymnaea stagnalis]|uniref:Uncharacterized protein n=1 Tax=Lymnaea stagnalis TaxID=6523 RepID=A0AAV2HG56_LYMST